MMTKFLAAFAIASLLAASAAPAMAKSHRTPGHVYNQHRVSPGASRYSPGHMMQTRGSVPGYPGASGYTPGHRH